MTERESELTLKSKSPIAATAIEATVALCREFLFLRKEFEAAEILLLERVGIQGSTFGYILELYLGELYISMNEISRARRFLEYASSSADDSIREHAKELLKSLEGASEQA